jgi:hypothetical protein
VMWPHLVRAMVFTESLDTNGDSLPDRYTDSHFAQGGATSSPLLRCKKVGDTKSIELQGTDFLNSKF